MYVEPFRMPKYMVPIMVCLLSQSSLIGCGFISLSCSKALAFDTVFSDGGGRHRTESTWWDRSMLDSDAILLS